ncbi:MAG: hypothetical protein BJ554DRAFT_4403 [Olpidium bornovanus]|uniref:Uncharacterized protein n=1 Tax=Olpidium bornovanus TaxID=278681 RepID=A0A8H7ZM90_9FUNG|nr:MAG: hypothetical protein BJ554DRAFT_4403 [Olpidium bornovanus]
MIRVLARLMQGVQGRKSRGWATSPGPPGTEWKRSRPADSQADRARTAVLGAQRLQQCRNVELFESVVAEALVAQVKDETRLLRAQVRDEGRVVVEDFETRSRVAHLDEGVDQPPAGVVILRVPRVVELPGTRNARIAENDGEGRGERRRRTYAWRANLPGHGGRLGRRSGDEVRRVAPAFALGLFVARGGARGAACAAGLPLGLAATVGLCREAARLRFRGGDNDLLGVLRLVLVGLGAFEPRRFHRKNKHPLLHHAQILFPLAHVLGGRHDLGRRRLDRRNGRVRFVRRTRRRRAVRGFVTQKRVGPVPAVIELGDVQEARGLEEVGDLGAGVQPLLVKLVADHPVIRDRHDLAGQEPLRVTGERAFAANERGVVHPLPGALGEVFPHVAAVDEVQDDVAPRRQQAVHLVEERTVAGISIEIPERIPQDEDQLEVLVRVGGAAAIPDGKRRVDGQAGGRRAFLSQRYQKRRLVVTAYGQVGIFPGQLQGVATLTAAEV